MKPTRRRKNGVEKCTLNYSKSSSSRAKNWKEEPEGGLPVELFSLSDLKNTSVMTIFGAPDKKSWTGTPNEPLENGCDRWILQKKRRERFHGESPCEASSFPFQFFWSGSLILRAQFSFGRPCFHVPTHTPFFQIRRLTSFAEENCRNRALPENVHLVGIATAPNRLVLSPNGQQEILSTLHHLFNAYSMIWCKGSIWTNKCLSNSPSKLPAAPSPNSNVILRNCIMGWLWNLVLDKFDIYVLSKFEDHCIGCSICCD